MANRGDASTAIARGLALTGSSAATRLRRAGTAGRRTDGPVPADLVVPGHTSAALALYLSVAVVLNRTVRRRWLRLLFVALCLVPPVLVAYARLYRGMHHPSDLAGSVVNAALCLWLAAHVVLKGPLPEDAPDEGERAAAARHG